MINSLKQLYKAPYNKIHPFFALKRFLHWKLIRILKLRNQPLTLWENRKIHINYDSIQSAWIMYNYWVDWEEFNAIKDTVKKGDTVLDVGANIGSYVLWFSKALEDTGSIHAFEPDPPTYSALCKNLAINNLLHIVVPNKLGISDKVEELKFSVGLDIQNQILTDSSSDFQLIPCTTLDSYIEEKTIVHIRYLKIDIEGFEYLALTGAKTALQNKIIDIIQLEINEKIENLNISPKALIAFANGFGYYLCKYMPEEKLFKKIEYSNNRENYFLVKESLL